MTKESSEVISKASISKACEPITIFEPVCGLSIAAKGIPIDLTVVQNEGKTTQVSYTVPENAQEDTAITTQVSPEGNLLIEISSTTGKRGFWDFVKLGKKCNIAVSLTISLPVAIDSVAAVLGMGHFKWEGPNVSKSFTVSLDIGEMSIQTPLLVESLDLSLTTGGIKVANAVVTDKAVCNVNVGEVKGAFSGYKAMSVKSSLGGVTVDLVPGVDSVTSLQCGGLGEVKANVSGFEGRFSAQTSGLGSVSVKAPGGISQNTNPCRGVVGPNQEPVGLLDVKVGMGGCNIVFSS